MIMVEMTLDQLEVIADALEFTGQCVEEEIVETAEGSEERHELIKDLEEITATMEMVANAMEAAVGDGDE
jgi:hypothetical protein